MNTMQPRIVIVGNGGWGTAVAVALASKKQASTIWGHDSDYLKACAETRENSRYLEGVQLPEVIDFEADLATALDDAEVVVCAVPTRFITETFDGEAAPQAQAMVSLSKGFNHQRRRFPAELVGDCLGISTSKLSALSGPTMAEEIAVGKPATATIGANDLELARDLQEIFSTPTFRLYASDDLVGVQLGGAVKNVIAIAAGIADGMGLGDNAKAALLARGLAEIRRLGAALGARPETLTGLSGVGDLYTTFASPHGRNRGFGERLGTGMTRKEATVAAGGKTVEGVYTASAVYQLSTEHGVDMPICEAIYQVLELGVSPKAAIVRLLERELKDEVSGHATSE